MTRVIAGAARGRRLTTLPGLHTRPSADRVKEALFSALAPLIPGSRVLDPFAGSGALGLEALSRGAAFALLVEADRRAARVCRDNMALVNLPGAQLLEGDCLRLVPPWLKMNPAFDLILADPPYDQGWLPRLLLAVEQGGWLAEGGLLVAETRAKDSEFVPGEAWQVKKRAVYGNTALWYCERKNL